MNQSVYIERDGELEEVSFNADDFSIDETTIDATLCNMGRLILQYGTIEAEVKLRVGRLASELERVEALLDSKVRKELREKGDKATEAAIRHAIIADEDYQNYVQALNQAERDQALMKWAMSALLNKSECLRAYAYRERQSMKMDHQYS